MQVAEQGSDAPIVNVRFRGRDLTTRFWPATATSPARFRASVGLEGDARGEAALEVSNAPKALMFVSQNVEPVPAQGLYAPGLLLEFLVHATQRVYSAA